MGIAVTMHKQAKLVFKADSDWLFWCKELCNRQTGVVMSMIAALEALSSRQKGIMIIRGEPANSQRSYNVVL
jgi:hypothetical protein